ncbi:Transposase DDE domain protein [Anatilimnocola aggregata]|uniref:Transposase DDE domain protein n=1 Tax=Anatilimnocola aggregata TaxID=2528021 RepID=A0A517YGC1_9BACT|nr:Transposase DDE domain protein [Anatilimnocola aggregata]
MKLNGTEEGSHPIGELATKVPNVLAHSTLPRLRTVFADGGYAGQLVDWFWDSVRWNLEIVKPTAAAGFQLLPKRWIVERTFAWLSQYRRHSRDYE